MKRNLFKVLSVFLVCTFLLGCGDAGIKKHKVLKLAHGLDPTHPVHKGMEFMAEKLAEKYNDAIEDIPGSQPVVNARENLSSQTLQIQQALDFPERLIELKAEISDRLGLAYQENGEWKLRHPVSSEKE